MSFSMGGEGGVGIIPWKQTVLEKIVNTPLSGNIV